MNKAEQKVVQYLDEAHATEAGLTRVLESQIAMTPRGAYRNALEQHLGETRDHAARVRERLRELRQAQNPMLAGIGFVETVIGQTLALWKAPLDLMRGTSGEEKLLKNAKDTCATEALEIATYTALEQVARAVGDDATAKLAASIRADEEKMLARVTAELPKLARAVVRAEVEGKPSFDASATGAADAIREAGEAVTRTARAAVPVTADDVAIPRYDELTADEVVGRLGDLSQAELATVGAYERKRQDRATVLAKVESLRGDEPWPGYDELTVAEVRDALREADEERTKAVRAYERAHKNRAGVIAATDRELANA